MVHAGLSLSSCMQSQLGAVLRFYPDKVGRPLTRWIDADHCYRPLPHTDTKGAQQYVRSQGNSYKVLIAVFEAANFAFDALSSCRKVRQTVHKLLIFFSCVRE